MSESDWYRNKAAECGRMADSATDTAVRYKHLQDQRNWIAIADNIVTADEATAKVEQAK